MPSDFDLIVRLLVAAAFGGLIGLEREMRDQPAGFRTHILVALGSCLFAIISAFGFGAFLGELPERVQFDPSRISAQIVTGIGFLGAGAIIRYGMNVRGLTTAASLWVVAAIGLAVALGEFTTGGVTTGITLAALWGLRRISPRLTRGIKPDHEEFILEVEPTMELEALIRAVTRAGLRVEHFRVEEEDGTRHVILVLRIPPGARPEETTILLTRTEGVRNVDWTR